MTLDKWIYSAQIKSVKFVLIAWWVFIEVTMQQLFPEDTTLKPAMSPRVSSNMAWKEVEWQREQLGLAIAALTLVSSS